MRWRTPEETRLIRRAYFVLGEKISTISKLFGRGRATIYRCLKQDGEQGVRGVRRPHVARRRRLILVLAKSTRTKNGVRAPRYPNASAMVGELLARWGIRASRRAVQRDLVISGWRCYVRKCVPTRRPPEVLKRAAFARRLLSEGFDPRQLVVSDETFMTANEGTGRQMWAKTAAGVLPLERKARYNVAHIQIWAACGVGWRSPLVIFPAKMTSDGEMKSFRLNAAAYIRRCLAVIVPHLQSRDLTLLQDGARCHTAYRVQDYLERKGVRTFPDWPPYSPDANPQEHVWAELKRRVGMMCPQTQEELVDAVKHCWASIPQSVLDAQVMSFGDRLRRLAATNGRYALA
jgi:transposase